MNTPMKADTVDERGMSIFESQIKDQVAGLHPEAFVAIDVDTGDFEVATEDWEAYDNLKVRRPNAIVFFRRVGSDISYFLGSASTE